MKAAVAALAFAVIAAGASGAAHAQLLHHYNFAGGSALDLTGTANGTLLGGAAFTASGVSFNGTTAYVQFGTALVPTSGAFSVALSAQQTGVTPGQYMELISQGFSGAPGFYIGHDPSHNFRLGDSFLSTGRAYPNDGAFHEFLYTFDPSAAMTVHFYIDGSLALQSSPSVVAGAGGTATRLGRQFDPFGEFLTGSIGHLEIYRGAISAVPEPEPYAMLVAGLGLLGFIARRRAGRRT
jgi:hypothetical protein